MVKKYIKIISKIDLKGFKEWSKKNLFNDSKFFSGLLDFSNENLDNKEVVDFYIYNKFVLKNKYEIDSPSWLNNIKGDDYYNFIDNLINSSFPKYKKIFYFLSKFLVELIKDLNLQKKDIWKTYEVVKIYWEFLDNLRVSDFKEYNSIIIYINKRTHLKLKDRIN